jgi:hypothetical protein
MNRHLTPTLLATALLFVAAIPVSGDAATSKSLPAVSTGAVREVTSASATLTGTVNAQGAPTTYAFQYGTDTTYALQSPAQYGGSATTSQPVTVSVTGLLPGTTYHVRLVAANSAGTGTGADVTFKTAGSAPAPGTPATVTSGAPTILNAHEALLTGTIDPRGSAVSYYFQFGAAVPYQVQTATQTLAASNATTAVSAPVSGLQDGRTYHYRLVAVNQRGEATAGTEQTLATPLQHRVRPAALRIKVSPAVRRTLPDVVTVSGTLEPGPEVEPSVGCNGIVDIVFRAHTIAVATQRAGIEPNCSFRLTVRFSVRRRLLGGHLQVHALFVGNHFLTRLEAPLKTIQVG